MDKTQHKIRIGGDFQPPLEEKMFQEMLERYGKTFAFLTTKFECTNLTIIDYIVS